MAAPYTVTILGTTMPWTFTGGINAALDFGLHDGTAPVVAFKDLMPGDIVTLSYTSGTVKASSARSAYDANGDTTSPSPVNANVGPSGKYYPSLYIPSASYPVNLVALVGCFADLSGNVIGTPFLVGDGPKVLTVPSGASCVQLGVNDDQYSDNTGSWVIRVVCGIAHTGLVGGVSRSQLGPPFGSSGGGTFTAPTSGQGWPLTDAG